MSDVVSAADAARAALASASGGAPVAVVAAIPLGSDSGGARGELPELGEPARGDAAEIVSVPGGAVSRVLVDGAGAVTGALPHASLHDAAVRLAAQALASPGSEALVEAVTAGGAEYLLYAEAHRPPEQLVIVGAGHIAVPLAALGSMLEFRVTVLDDREEFATTDRFAAGVNVKRADFESDPFAGVEVGAGTYLALVTRGHRWDFDCLHRLLVAGVEPRYIGMVGSRRRVRAAFHALLDVGVPRAALARIHAPIGLEIGAETPAEIAVSIAAEMVAVRRGAGAGATDSISARERVLDRFLKEG